MLAGIVQELGDSVMVVVKVERVACLSFVRGLYSSTPVYFIAFFSKHFLTCFVPATLNRLEAVIVACSESVGMLI